LPGRVARASRVSTVRVPHSRFLRVGFLSFLQPLPRLTRPSRRKHSVCSPVCRHRHKPLKILLDTVYSSIVILLVKYSHPALSNFPVARSLLVLPAPAIPGSAAEGPSSPCPSSPAPSAANSNPSRPAAPFHPAIPTIQPSILSDTCTILNQ
jgi:hypothetical protein